MTQMIDIRRSPGRGGGTCLALLALALAFAPGLAPGRPVSAGADAGLSPRLAKLATPSLRGAGVARQADELGLPESGPGSLLREGKRVLVEVQFDRGAAAAADDLREAGARIVSISRRYQSVAVAATPADLRAIAAVPGSGEVSEVLAPVVAGNECQGLVTSEGDVQLEAASARAAFDLDGAGVRVGILSNSFDRNGSAPTHASGDAASGDLPGAGNPCGRTTPVGVFDDPVGPPEGTDEGRAMAQVVHDLAPGATLSFATALGGQKRFAANIERLAAPVAAGGAGANVIADDVFYLEEPFFQDGPVATAINSVTARGVAYFTAAGNDNVVEGGADVASYEAPFRDAGSCPLGVPPAETECMDFDPGETGIDNRFELEVEPDDEVRLDLQWAEPWFGVQTNLDAYLLDGAGSVLSEDTRANETTPFEFLAWKNKTGLPQTVGLAIPRHAGSAPDPLLKFVQVGNGVSDVVPTPEQLETSAADTIGPTVIGHSGASAAVSVAAVGFDDSARVEDYSSRGPVSKYFAPVTGTGSAAGDLGSGQVVAKPDLAATDCGRTTFFLPTGSPGIYRFCGTSAAAPHAAAVAALMLQANPSLPSSQLRTTLAATARPVGAFGPNAVGAGLIDAYGAVSSVALAPSISITERPPALGRNRRPSIGFSANRPVSFSCSLDGGALAPCSSPFIPPAPLADGVHGFVVQGVDAAGRAGQSELVGFKIDAKRPRTFFRKHPRKTIRTRKRRVKAVFRFGSNEQDVVFACKVDSGFLRFCKPRLVRRFRPGAHVVSVTSRDAAGNVDGSPAVFRFRVERRG